MFHKYLINVHTKNNNKFTNRIEGLIELILLILEKCRNTISIECNLLVKKQIDVLVRLIIFDSKCFKKLIIQ
jgi:hypothetical protein